MAYTTIDDPSAHFQTALYSGNASTNVITNDGNSDLQPDLVWIKNRSTSGKDHVLYDSSRGVNKQMYSNSSNTEDSVSNGLTSFNTDGFTLGDNGGPNASGNHVAWQWKANGGTASGSFSESGSNPAVSYQTNQTAGFSIMTYTGTGSNGSFAHGLTKAPEYWVVKPRTNVSDNQWFVCHKNINGTNTDYANYFIHWDTTGGKQDNNLMWQDTNPDSSSIYLGSKPGTNSDGGSFIAYAWHGVQGYSKFGFYKGNAGEPEGPFVYTGFKPAFIKVKACSENGQAWIIGDNKRDPDNVAVAKLFVNTTGAESAAVGDNNWDFLSNGFKIRTQDDGMNKSGVTFFYCAYAEHPFVSSEGVPTTAR